MKRALNIFISLIILIFILGYPDGKITLAGSQNMIRTELPNYVMEFVDNRSQYGEFRVWSNESISRKSDIYNSKGEMTACLFNIIHGKGTIGYLIVNPYSLEIYEYALGLSPYEAFINAHKLEKHYDELRLIYDGPGLYGISIKAGAKTGFKKPIYILRDKKINIDRLENVRALVEEKGLDLNNKNFTAIRKQSTTNGKLALKQVSDEARFVTECQILEVEDFVRYKGCGATAGANIVYYLKKQYPRLVSRNQPPRAVIEELASRMYTTLSATLPTDFRDGLSSYLNMSYRYPDKFKVEWCPNSSGKKTFDTICREISGNEPGAVLYLGSPYWGNHYATFVGFSRIYSPKGISCYYIIQDGWSITPVNIYRNWKADEPFIESLFIIDKLY